MYKNIEDKKEYMRKYYLRNKNKLKEQHKKYYENNKEELIEKQKKYNMDNNENTKKYMSEYIENNKEKIKEYRKKYYILNKEKMDEYKKNYVNLRLKNDSFFKLKWNIKTLIKYSFKSKSIKKSTTTENILGCSFMDFKLYLESKFEPWMTWENRGLYNGNINYGWDIDHIIPISLAKNEEDVIRLNHYSNLRPLCSYTNRNIKRNK